MKPLFAVIFIVLMFSTFGCRSTKHTNQNINNNIQPNDEIQVVKPKITLVKTNNLPESLISDFKKEFIVAFDTLNFRLLNETVFFIGEFPKTRESQNNKSIFYNPSYFIYKNLVTNKYEKIKVEFHSCADIELSKELLSRKYADIDGDKVPEVLYSYDFPMPEQIARTLHILKYNSSTGSFEDFKVEGSAIATWEIVDKNKDNVKELFIEFDQYFPTEKPFERYYKMKGNNLVELIR